MTTWLPRSAWTTVPKPRGLVAMPSKPRGVAVHWPGTTTKIGRRTQANMAARLEGYRRFHVNGRGWTDIAYQSAVDQDGRVWDLRGIEHQSAANGNQVVNREWLACLLLLGPGEHPTDDMRAAFTDWREKALRRYPSATRVVGHRDVRPEGTTCPGPITEHLIRTSSLLLKEDTMAKLDADDLKAIDRLIGERITDGKWLGELARRFWAYKNLEVTTDDAYQRQTDGLNILKVLKRVLVDEARKAGATSGDAAAPTFSLEDVEKAAENAVRRVLGSLDEAGQ